MGTTNMQAAEMMGLYPSPKKKPASKPMPKPMPMRGERTAKNKAKKPKK
jgi:hypothetical protein